MGNLREASEIGDYEDTAAANGASGITSPSGAPEGWEMADINDTSRLKMARFKRLVARALGKVGTSQASGWIRDFSTDLNTEDSGLIRFRGTTANSPGNNEGVCFTTRAVQGSFQWAFNTEGHLYVRANDANSDVIDDAGFSGTDEWIRVPALSSLNDDFIENLGIGETKLKDSAASRRVIADNAIDDSKMGFRVISDIQYIVGPLTNQELILADDVTRVDIEISGGGGSGSSPEFTEGEDGEDSTILQDGTAIVTAEGGLGGIIGNRQGRGNTARVQRGGSGGTILRGGGATGGEGAVYRGGDDREVDGGDGQNGGLVIYSANFTVDNQPTLRYTLGDGGTGQRGSYSGVLGGNGAPGYMKVTYWVGGGAA